MLDPVSIALDKGLRLVSVVRVWFVFIHASSRRKKPGWNLYKDAANGEKHIMEGQG